MDIRKLKEEHEYIMTHAYGQPWQKIKVLSIQKCCCENSNWSADIIYTSNDQTKGLITSINKIECERYLLEIID